MKNFESKGKTPKSFDNKFKFMRNKFKTISTYEYLRKTKEYKNDALFYEVCVYSNAENAFGNTDDFLLDKIPSKIIKAINKSNNIFILLNYSSEGFISEECLLNINNWIKNNSRVSTAISSQTVIVFCSYLINSRSFGTLVNDLVNFCQKKSSRPRAQRE